MPLLKIGSSKDVWVHPEHPTSLGLFCSERVSVFDIGPIPTEFTGLGALRCGIATRVFEVWGQGGIRTHFVKRLSATELLVSPFDIPEMKLSYEGSQGRVLPLEILFRFVITKKFFDRIERGEVDRARVERLLIGERGLAIGTRMNLSFIECSTKWQAADGYISDQEAAKLARISLAHLHAIYDETAVAAVCLQNFFRQAGFDLQTGKFEVALRKDGKFVIVDSISPDELQLIGPDGKSYDKDPVRQWYEKNQPEWMARVKKAKAEFPNDKSMWPTYEAVPPAEIVTEMVDNYRKVAEAIGARITR